MPRVMLTAPSAGARPCALRLWNRGWLRLYSPPFRTFESQVGTAAPTPPLSAALGLSCRRLATAGNEVLGRRGLPPPHPRFPLLPCKRLATAGNEALGRWGLPPPLPRFPKLPCKRLATAGHEALGRWGLPPPHPRFPLRSVCLADGSLPRTTKRLAGRGHHPQPHAFLCARFVLQTARYCGSEALAIVHAHWLARKIIR